MEDRAATLRKGARELIAMTAFKPPPPPGCPEEITPWGWKQTLGQFSWIKDSSAQDSGFIKSPDANVVLGHWSRGDAFLVLYAAEEAIHCCLNPLLQSPLIQFLNWALEM